MAYPVTQGETVKPWDETGFRVGGQIQWSHDRSADLTTGYRVVKKRDELFDGLQGQVVCDRVVLSPPTTELPKGIARPVTCESGVRNIKRSERSRCRGFCSF